MKSLLVKLTIILSIFIAQSSVAESPKKPDETFSEETTTKNGVRLLEYEEIWYGKGFNDEKYEDLKKKIGWVFQIDSKVRHTKKALDNSLPGYDVLYTINELGQRVLPDTGARSSHLILAGDSNTFGWGVKDTETLPYLASLKYQNYHVYNFGHGGGSASNTLALLETSLWNGQVKGPKGQFIYIFYPQWMIDRVLGTKNFLVWDKGGSPWYEVEDGKLVRKGQFKDRPLTYALRFLSFIDVFGWIGDLPKTSQKHVELFTKIFVRMKELYLAKFPEGKFSVVLSYYHVYDPSWVKALAASLKRSNVETKEIHTERNENKKYHSIDYHFNYEGQKNVLEELSKVHAF